MIIKKYITCPVCKGTGKKHEEECLICKGTGKIRQVEYQRNFKKTLL